jgi:magnesium-transporting ATPase (P-type)
MTAVVLLQVFEAHASRSPSASVFGLSPLSNRALLAATATVLVLQAAVVFVPPLQGLFGTAGLSPLQMIVAMAAGLFVLLVVEGAKGLGRRASRP